MQGQEEPVAASDPECRVLMVAEKPSVATAIAEALSAGRKRTRGAPPLRTHDCYHFFPPARSAAAN